MKSEKRMFKNPVLELLSLSGPKMMVTFHLVLASILVFSGWKTQEISVLTLIGVFLSGLLVWTLFEYLMHRFLFHTTGESKFIKAFHYAMHGYHHSHPNDHKRLFMPPVPALIFLAVFFGLFYLVMGSNVFFFLAGFEIGYLVYSLMHYAIHVDSSNAYVQKMKHHHNLHHYKFDDKAFGVSSTFWDHVFKTMPPKIKSRT
jgi:sterol desaturase/sphingolipid hydroxylase (fatty acid hydroxylase superfamily)